MNRSYTTPYAIVIANDVSVWGSHGNPAQRPVSGLAYDLPGTLDTLAAFCERSSLTEVPVIFDTDTPAAEITRQSDALRARGWHFTELRAWTRVARAGTVFYLGFRSEFSDSRVPLFAGAENAHELHRRATAFHHAIGAPFWGAPGMVGCELIRSTAPDGPRAPRWSAPLPLAVKPAGPLHWQSVVPPTRTVVALDVNAAYLAAAGVSEVASDALEHSTDSQFYPGRAGYWHVQFTSPERVAERVQHTSGLSALDWSRVAPDGTVWLTAPVARDVLAGGHGVPWRIVESWTAPAVRAVLRPWAEQLRAAYVATQGSDAVGHTVRRVYKDTTGMLARAGGRVHRPDWAHHVIDLARVNLLRRIHRFNDDARGAAVPRLVGVNVDEVQYELCDGWDGARLLDALNHRHREGFPGAMKPAGEIEPAAWIEQHQPRKRGR